MASTTKPISEVERAERAARLARVLATLGLEGLEPSGEAREIFDRYASGELSLEEVGSKIQALHDREYGPLHVSRD